MHYLCMESRVVKPRSIVFVERDVIEAVKEIDVHKSASSDYLSTRVLKDAFKYLIPHLTHMCNCSLRTSI